MIHACNLKLYTQAIHFQIRIVPHLRWILRWILWWCSLPLPECQGPVAHSSCPLLGWHWGLSHGPQSWLLRWESFRTLRWEALKGLWWHGWGPRRLPGVQRGWRQWLSTMHGAHRRWRRREWANGAWWNRDERRPCWWLQGTGWQHQVIPWVSLGRASRGLCQDLKEN